MKAHVFTANILAILFTILVLVGTYQGLNNERGKKFKYYRIGTWLCLSALLVDASVYLVETYARNDFLIGFLAFFSFIFVDVLIAVFSFYVFYIIKEVNPKINKTFPISICILTAIDIIFIAVGAITGHLYSVSGGAIHYGVLKDFVIIIPGIALLSLFVVNVLNIKKLGVKSFIALSVYMIMPGLAAIINIINPEVEVGYISSALATMTIFVMLQSKSINESDVRAKLYDILSKKDVLTGLKNRRGYDEIIDNIDPEENVGVTFSDINNLKEVNDKLGHEAGDNLIKELTSILLENFPDDDICRISGDEFVVIMHNVDESFDEKMITYCSHLKEHRCIASFGYMSGKGKDVLELIRQSEKMMYKNKEEYYKESNKCRRI